MGTDTLLTDTHALPPNPHADSLQALHQHIVDTGFAFVPGWQMRDWLAPGQLTDWPQFSASWDDMPHDTYMADGGRYRRRRHATLSATAHGIQLEPHQPHYQSLDYNPLNGGVARHFAAVPAEVATGNTMQQVLTFCHQLFSQLGQYTDWHIEVHQFRIEARPQALGKPTPEGIHRDGVDYVLVMMVQRRNVSSGTTTMHDMQLRELDSFTLTSPLDCAIVDDKRCLHGVTPVEVTDPAQPAYRDVLVVTFRKR